MILREIKSSHQVFDQKLLQVAMHVTCRETSHGGYQRQLEEQNRKKKKIEMGGWLMGGRWGWLIEKAMSKTRRYLTRRRGAIYMTQPSRRNRKPLMRQTPSPSPPLKAILFQQ
ncbi:hypothetical protein LSTR_LSTR014316 [Laodelphax striatellus]|uniref:Uncharacterized protein n=1 Tax=Laodelphax striatellus TaxID=195883 RepID=A0A482WZ17_LAOST|nr:hypothetical protein LSTR_LSTR014316 [Laodelphax striatellus]